jgi:hypothetical protein
MSQAAQGFVCLLQAEQPLYWQKLHLYARMRGKIRHRWLDHDKLSCALI